MIFYFSATGNSRWAAKQLAQSLGEESLVYIPDALQGDCRYTLRMGERLGFVFPIHGWRPSKIVRQFVSRLQISNVTYVFMLCTAGDNIGRAAEIFEGDLRRKGLHLDACFSLLMPESYVGLPFMDVDTSERERQKKEQAAQDLKTFTEDIRNQRTGVVKTVKGHLPWLLSGPIGAFFVHCLVTDKPFHVNSTKCVKCGICADVCPVGDIDGGLGKEPQWLHKDECLSCFNCYHHCPHHAIEYGKRTSKKGQYFYDRNKLR